MPNPALYIFDGETLAIKRGKGRILSQGKIVGQSEVCKSQCGKPGVNSISTTLTLSLEDSEGCRLVPQGSTLSSTPEVG